MTSNDISEAMAYERIEPFGEWRADLRSGIIAATIANVNKGKGDKAFSPKDFMPDFTEKKPESLKSKILQVFKGI